jgi:hypothetical protein
MLKKPSLEPRTKNEQEEIMPNKSHEPYRMYSPSLDAMMREVVHTLGNIDFANEIELDKVEKSAVEPKLKEYIKDKIRASHREKREPYVDLLDRFRRQQYRQSFAA